MKNTYKLKFTVLQYEILKVLCVKAGEKLNQRQIALLLGVTSPAIAKALKPLTERELIITHRSPRMNLVEIELNRRSRQAIVFKRAENLKTITETGLDTALEDIYPGTTIILFGSYARGEDTTRSDIDIAVIGAEPKKTDLKEFEKLLERTITIQHYTTLRDIRAELRSNICNGITLIGAIEL